MGSNLLSGIVGRAIDARSLDDELDHALAELVEHGFLTLEIEGDGRRMYRLTEVGKAFNDAHFAKPAAE